MKPGLRAALLLTVPTMVVLGAETYQKPPQAVLGILNSPTTPTFRRLNFGAYLRHEQGSPVRYHAHRRIGRAHVPARWNPASTPRPTASTTLHPTTPAITLIKIPEGTETKLALPPGAKVTVPRWTSDGSHFAFMNYAANAIEVWVGDTSGRVHKVPNLRLNEVFGGGGGRGGAAAGGAMQWMPGGKSILVHSVRPNRGVEPPTPKSPPGPDVQETLGGGRGADVRRHAADPRMTKTCRRVLRPPPSSPSST